MGVSVASAPPYQLAQSSRLGASAAQRSATVSLVSNGRLIWTLLQTTIRLRVVFATLVLPIAEWDSVILTLLRLKSACHLSFSSVLICQGKPQDRGGSTRMSRMLLLQAPRLITIRDVLIRPSFGTLLRQRCNNVFRSLV